MSSGRHNHLLREMLASYTQKKHYSYRYTKSTLDISLSLLHTHNSYTPSDKVATVVGWDT